MRRYYIFSTFFTFQSFLFHVGVVMGEGAVTPEKRAGGTAVSGVTSVSVGFGHWWAEALLLPLLTLRRKSHAGLMAPTAQGHSDGRETWCHGSYLGSAPPTLSKTGLTFYLQSRA